ncbi:MAG: NTP transferase domain-containing protein [Acidobacteriota bacterium]|nr:MAG: NTP transferase domain-containing protein [Acidobacteriota bacterium]
MSLPAAAMILAAGHGERMQPLTKTRAKPTLPILGLSLLERVLIQLGQCGIARFAVNAYHHVDSVHSCCESSGLEVELFAERELMGTGGALIAPTPVLESGSTFLLHNGDTLAFAPIGALDRAAREDRCAGALLVRLGPRPGYGSVRIRGGRVVGIERSASPNEQEADSARGSELATYLGIAVLRREVLARIPPRRCDLFTDVLLPMRDESWHLNAVTYDGPWLEFTSPESYCRQLSGLLHTSARQGYLDLPGGRAAVRAAASGVMFLGEGASCEAGASLEGAIVLERGARICRGAFVCDTIVLEGAKLSGGTALTRTIVEAGVVTSGDLARRDGVLTRSGADRSAWVPFGTERRR